MKFLGYPRPDGSAGTRNFIGIIPSVFCANRVAKGIGDNIQNSVVLSHTLGCGQHGADHEQTLKTLAGLGRHPNLGAVLIVSLGCEKISPEELRDAIAVSGKPVEVISIQDLGGTIKAIEQGTKILSGWAEELQAAQREEIAISKLVVGLKCGGTDATSGIAANPALGFASDIIIRQGGTAILSEVTELIGAEHVLAKRAKNPEIAQEILATVGKAEAKLREKTKNVDRVSMQGALVSAGNFDGGVSSVAEKALGGMYKSGTAPICGVVGYGEKPPATGLYLMDSPGVDNEVITSMVAGGANVVVFTTGRGTPSGFPFVPVIKVTGNSRTYHRMLENIDINAGTIVDGQKSLPEAGEELYR
ncbi:MAG TPA: UxaA family hydrolase, partial [Negativicutes bacterium]|nr:UxaA family hydrolase [Negativicutes bacterium]